MSTTTPMRLSLRLNPMDMARSAGVDACHSWLAFSYPRIMTDYARSYTGAPGFSTRPGMYGFSLNIADVAGEVRGLINRDCFRKDTVHTNYKASGIRIPKCDICDNSGDVDPPGTEEAFVLFDGNRQNRKTKLFFRSRKAKPKHEDPVPRHDKARTL